MSLTLKKHLVIPKKWFFFNPTIISNHKFFYKISNKDGVVFLLEGKKKGEFFRLIQPYIFWCRKNNIKFIIPYSTYWAIKYQAFGIMVDSKCKKINSLNEGFIRKKFFIVSRVHDFKEAINIKKFVDLVFLTPVFKTRSYVNKIPLTRYTYISLCFFFKEKMIFALGGVNYKNFNFTKNKTVHGFGGINNFKER